MHPTADTWQTLIIAVTYTVEMGGGEKMEKIVCSKFQCKYGIERFCVSVSNGKMRVPKPRDSADALKIAKRVNYR